jgi:hypothetical protein
MRAVVNYKVYELAAAIQFLVGTFCNGSINKIVNPKTFYNHSFTWQYYSIPSLLLQMVDSVKKLIFIFKDTLR